MPESNIRPCDETCPDYRPADAPWADNTCKRDDRLVSLPYCRLNLPPEDKAASVDAARVLDNPPGLLERLSHWWASKNPFYNAPF